MQRAISSPVRRAADRGVGLRLRSCSRRGSGRRRRWKSQPGSASVAQRPSASPCWTSSTAQLSAARWKSGSSWKTRVQVERVVVAVALDHRGGLDQRHDLRVDLARGRSGPRPPARYASASCRLPRRAETRAADRQRPSSSHRMAMFKAGGHRSVARRCARGGHAAARARPTVRPPRRPRSIARADSSAVHRGLALLGRVRRRSAA